MNTAEKIFTPEPGSDEISAARVLEQSAPAPGFAIYAGIFLTSAAVLLFEVALTRVFSVMLWAHLAYMVVGTALFGFGLSGVFLALGSGQAKEQSRGELAALCALLAAAMVGCYLVVLNVPFRMWQFMQDPMNFVYLAVWYVALVVPFFLAGIIVAKILSGYSDSSAKLYGVDLIGAAVGSLLLIPFISTLGGEGCVIVAAVLAACAGVAFLPAQKHAARLLMLIGVFALATLAMKAPEMLAIKLHQTKRRFNQAVNAGQLKETLWSTLSRVDVAYHNQNVLDIWIDGGTNESAILRWDGKLETLQPLTWSTIGAVYDLKRGSEPNTMIIGPSGGKEVLFALSHGAGHVDAVEMDPSIVKLVNDWRYAKYMGFLYQQKQVTLINDEGRSFLRRQPENSYDIIQSVNNYTPVALSSGALNLSAAYLLTKEALNDYLDHLTPDGVLALHRGATLRVALMAMEVLAERGVEHPADHILITTGEVPYFEGFFLKKSPWLVEEATKIGGYLKDRPLMQDNRFLWNPFDPEPGTIYTRIMQTPAGELKKYHTALGVSLFPATDDTPFIENLVPFGKREIDRELPAEFHSRHGEKWRGIIPKGDFPYVAILAESALLALLVLVLPLVFRARASTGHRNFRSFLTYFSGLGFGFIVIEICLMKRYVLFLGNPAYSITTVLVALLCSAGIGSILCSRWIKRPKAALKVVIPALVALVLAETAFSPIVFQQFLSAEFGVRVAIASAMLFPLGLLMGMPFSLGLALINLTSPNEAVRRQVTAWAWGANGFWTVIGSASTVFIAVLAGFKVALLVATAAYVASLVSLRKVTV